MLQNYLKTALRNLLRNKLYALINICGLAVGMASCLLLLLYIGHQRSYDQVHQKGERVYRIIRQDQGAAGPEYGSDLASGALAGALRQTLPQIEETARLMNHTYEETWVRHGQKTLKQQLCRADASILDVFTLPLKRGDAANALKDPHTVLITETMAFAYFGDADPLGQILHIEGSGDYHITGVLADLSPHSTLQFDLLHATVPQDWLNWWEGWHADGSGWRPLETYVLLREGADYRQIEEEIAQLVQARFGAEASAFSYHLQPLQRIYLYSSADYDLEGYGDINQVRLFTSIAALVLLMACANYINLATTRSLSRAREVGVRKASGARRGQLAGQFFGESALVIFLATLLAAALAHLALPVLNTFISAELSLSGDGQWLLLPLVGALTALLAGAYPALYLARLDAVKALKGANPSGKAAGRIRQIGVVFQFSATLFLLVAAGVIYQQWRFMSERNLGFNKEQIVVLPIVLMDPAPQWSAEWLGSHPDRVKEVFLHHPNVLSTSLSHLFLPGGIPQKIRVPGEVQARSLHNLVIDRDFLATYEIGLTAGRGFSPDIDGYADRAAILNRAAVEFLGWDEPLGKTFVEGDRTWTVIGVCDDFHNARAHQAVKPMFLTRCCQPRVQLSLRLRAGQIAQTMDFLAETWHQLLPQRPFAYVFLDEWLDHRYREQTRAGQICVAFSLLAFFVACLGLFGLAAFSAEQCRKEIGVRKVLGASVRRLVFMLSREYLRLVLLAVSVSLPLSYWLMEKWLQEFAYRIEMGAGVFALSGLLTLAIAWTTVGGQAFKVALGNPVEALRSE